MKNRNRIAEKNKAGGPKDTKAAPAKGDGRGNPTERVPQVEVDPKIGARVTKFAISSKRVNAIRGRTVHISM